MVQHPHLLQLGSIMPHSLLWDSSSVSFFISYQRLLYLRRSGVAIWLFRAWAAKSGRTVTYREAMLA